MVMDGSPVPQAISSTRMPGATVAATTIASVIPLPMAADCLRHFWLALARLKLFQSGLFEVVIDLLHFVYRCLSCGVSAPSTISLTAICPVGVRSSPGEYGPSNLRRHHAPVARLV